MERIDANDPSSIRYRMRKKRFILIERLIEEVLVKKKFVRILDVGGTTSYWKLMKPDLWNRVHVTILNTQKELDTHRGNGLGATLEEVTGNGCSMPEFEDCSFDIAHSNSVIEHVGSYSNMIKFAAETRRVGRGYYLQTPYLWFPLEPHYGIPFIHWLPDALRIRLHSRFNVGYAQRCNYEEAMQRVDGVRLVDKKLIKTLFPDANIIPERFALMVKSLICVRKP